MKLSERMWVIIADGEGAEACVIAGSDLHQSVHDFMCACEKPWKQCECGHGMVADIQLLDDLDSWILDENGEKFSCSWPHETGKIITIYALSRSKVLESSLAAKDAEIAAAREESRLLGREQIMSIMDQQGFGGRDIALRMEQKDAEIARLREHLRCEQSLHDKMVSAFRQIPFGHTSHWDKTGGSGTGCPLCIAQNEARDKWIELSQQSPALADKDAEIARLRSHEYDEDSCRQDCSCGWTCPDRAGDRLVYKQWKNHRDAALAETPAAPKEPR